MAAGHRAAGGAAVRPESWGYDVLKEEAARCVPVCYNPRNLAPSSVHPKPKITRNLYSTDELT
jgi:hypothetical protein